MIKKLSIIIGLVALASTAQAAVTLKTMQTLTAFCATAYADYRKTGDPKMLSEGLKGVGPDASPVLSLTCYAYAQGFMHGEKRQQNRLRMT